MALGSALISFQDVYAASGITYTGRIIKGDQPLDSGIVRFDVWIKTKDNCVLYYERRNIDMSGSGGTYSFEIGDANIVPGSQSFPQTGIQNISDLFNNNKSHANGDVDGSLQCVTFSPASDEGRLMTVSFTPAGETAQALPDLAITAVPTSFRAFNADKVNGYGTGDLLKVDPTVVKTTYANGALTQAQYDEFWKLILGTSTTYLKAIPTLGGDINGTLPAVTVTKIQNVAVTAPTTGDTGKVLTYNGTGMVWSAAAAGGITTLNGLSGTTQSFVSGTTPLTITSSGSAHTFNITNASSSSSGLLTQTDWITFNSKQSSALGSGQVWIGNASNGAQAQTLSGDATVSASGNVIVDKTQTATGSKILQLDSSGNAYVAGVDIKGSSAAAKLRFTGSTDMVMNLPTTSGTANQFLQTDGAGNLSWASQSAMLPAISAGHVWVGNASGGAQAFTLSGDVASVSNTGLVTLTSSATGSNKLPLAGGTMSGAINMGGQNISNAGDVSLAAGKFLGLGVGSTAGTVAGQIWYDSGIIKYFDGTSARSLGVAGSGITSLNGLTTGTQSFVVGSAGNSPAITSSGSAHTLDIPMASASSVTAGLISNADYAAFNSKMGNALPAGQVWVGNTSGAAIARTLSGDVTSISDVGLVTLNKTTLGLSNKLLQLDSTGIANSYGIGLSGATSGQIYITTMPATAVYGLRLPATAPLDNQILKANSSGDLSWVTYLAQVSNSAPLTNGKMWIGNASGVASEVAMSGDATITNAGLLTLKNTGTVGTYTKVITDAQGRVTSGSALVGSDVVAALGYTPVNKAGDTMSGDLNSQNLNIAAGKFLGLGAGSTAGTVAGQLWYDSGVIKYFDGTSARSLGVAGSGITSLNGLTTGTQSFVIGSAGNSPAMTSAGSAHTLDIPMASASSVTAGLISNADYSSMMAKQSNSLASGQVWIGNGSGAAQAHALSGDVTISNVGLATLKSVGTAGTYFKVVTDAQGRVTSGSALASGDVTTALGYTPTSAGSGYINGGNTFAGNATIGLNDNYNLGFKTNNTTKMTLTSDGKLGIGTVTPNTALTIASGDITLDAGYSMMWGQSSYSFINGDAGPSSHLVLGTSGSIVMILDVNGNVGIGTNPSFTMDMGSRTDAVRLPQGTTAQRPANTKGIIRYNTSTDTVEYNNGSTWATVGSSLGYTPVNKAGDTMSGDLNTQNLNIAAGKFLGLGAGSTAGTVAGQVWYDSGVIKYFDGTTTKSLGVAGSGITSLNGLTSNTQSFVIGSAGNSPAMTSAGSAHTLDIPMAAASASVTAGLISNADYKTFKNKQSNDLIEAAIWVGNVSGGAEARALSGDVAGVNNIGMVTIVKTTTGESNKILALDGSGVANAYGVGVKGATSGTVAIQAANTTANYSLTLPATSPTANQIMQSNGSGVLSWVSNSANVNNAASLTSGKMWLGNSGNVAVEVAMSGDATISNAGLLSLKSTGTAGTYWKVVTDAQGRVTSGSALASGDVTTALGFTPASAGSGYVNGGNSFGANATIGLNDAYSLGIKAGGSTRMTLDSGGNVGIGQTSPGSLLHITDSNKSVGSLQANVQIQSSTTGVDNGGTLTFSGEDGAASGRMFATIAGRKENSTSGDYAGYFQIATRPNGGVLTEKMRVDSTGRVGIGATAPISKLQVHSTANADNAISVSVAGSGNAERPRLNLVTWADSNPLGSSSNNRGWSVGAYGNAYGTGDANSLDFSYWGGVTWTTALHLGNDGNVGIGSAVPSYSLDMSGKTDAIRLPAGTTAQRPTTAAGLFRYNTSNNAVEFYNGTTWVTLAASSGSMANTLTAGQMWVGNASGVAQAFALSGDISSVSNTGLVTIDKTQAAANSKILQLSATGTAYTKGVDINGGGAGSLQIRYPSSATTVALTFPASSGTANQFLQTDGNGTLTWASAGASLPTIASTQVWVGNSSGGAQARTLSGDVTIDNVGLVTLKSVGTAGTYFKVTTDAQGRVTSGSTLLSSDVVTALGFTPSSGSSGYVNGGNTYAGNATIGLNDAYNLGFETNNTTQMTLTSGGNLGVGTASPAAKVHIKGTAPTSVTVANEYLHLGGTEQVNGGYQVIGFGYYSSEAYPNAYMGLVQTSVAGSGKGDLVFGARNSTSDVAPSELMRINSAGGVGIGTSTINNNLSFSGQAAQKVGVERITTAASAGSDFTITAGGAYSGGTNLAGGTLTLSSGTSTGSGGSQILLQTATASTSGTTDRAPATKVTISGTTSSDAMQVAGTIRGTSVDNVSSTTIDWSKGNTQYTAAGCTGTQYTFSNMRDGGVYTLAITGTFSANCTFGQTSPDTLSGTPTTGAFYFLPANSIPSGSNAIYSFMRVGNKVYVQWNSGFQN